MPDSRPIGVFDSGLGGLTVAKAIKEKLPNENIVYLGDTARVPYGNKSTLLVTGYATQITNFLLGENAKLIVVACNTASALALPALQSEFLVPILGVIIPGSQAAVHATRNKHVGVIGTTATINSNAYTQALREIESSIQITTQACPLFVPLVEEGWLNGPVPSEITASYLKNINMKNVDTLILGCTHYPLLKPIIQDIVNDNTVLIDSAETVAEEVAIILIEKKMSADSSNKGLLKCFVTDSPIQFENIAKRFLGYSLNNVQTVPIH
jgi:glutamate racemase